MTTSTVTNWKARSVSVPLVRLFVVLPLSCVAVMWWEDRLFLEGRMLYLEFHGRVIGSLGIPATTRYNENAESGSFGAICMSSWNAWGGSETCNRR